MDDPLEFLSCISKMPEVNSLKPEQLSLSSILHVCFFKKRLVIISSVFPLSFEVPLYRSGFLGLGFAEIGSVSARPAKGNAQPRPGQCGAKCMGKALPGATFYMQMTEWSFTVKLKHKCLEIKTISLAEVSWFFINRQCFSKSCESSKDRAHAATKVLGWTESWKYLSGLRRVFSKTRSFYTRWKGAKFIGHTNSSIHLQLVSRADSRAQNDWRPGVGASPAMT